ncbi:MAG: hypothetical protein EOS71_27795 [Mesorhizobium sp.]|nr:MAG: hypothetical protein EOS71_27795 [Mesorhizobium sp.]
MQIVSRATTAAGEAVLRVLFCGEGGECVTVDMATEESGSDEAVLDRARAILVQTANFGMAGNTYDAQSNGNFDEVAVTAVKGKRGGVYIFEYRDGEGSRQVPPSKMPSFEAAREEAIRCAILSQAQTRWPIDWYACATRTVGCYVRSNSGGRSRSAGTTMIYWRRIRA